MTALGKLVPHHHVQVDAGLPHACSRCLRRSCSGYFALEHPPPDYRTDHRYGQRRDYRVCPNNTGRAASGGWSFAVDERARRPGSSLYLVTTLLRPTLAGNVTSLQPGTLDNTPAGPRRPIGGSTRRAPDHPVHMALVRVFQLPGGFRILVGAISTSASGFITS